MWANYAGGTCVGKHLKRDDDLTNTFVHPQPNPYAPPMVGGHSTKWGISAALIVSVPIFMLKFLVDVLGDCATDTCTKGFLSQVLFPSAGTAITVFLGVRLLPIGYLRKTYGQAVAWICAAAVAMLAVIVFNNVTARLNWT